jgi:hypothetical protein
VAVDAHSDAHHMSPDDMLSNHRWKSTGRRPTSTPGAQRARLPRKRGPSLCRRRCTLPNESMTRSFAMLLDLGAESHREQKRAVPDFEQPEVLPVRDTGCVGARRIDFCLCQIARDGQRSRTTCSGGGQYGCLRARAEAGRGSCHLLGEAMCWCICVPRRSWLA